MRTIACLAICALLVPVLGGCGGKVTGTPDSTARAYVNFMKAGKFQEAALLWDYTTQARRDNENWDEIVESQRKLIIGKLAEEKAQALQQWETHFSGATVGAVEETGERARAEINDARVTGLDLVKVGDEWLISNME